MVEIQWTPALGNIDGSIAITQTLGLARRSCSLTCVDDERMLRLEVGFPY